MPIDTVCTTCHGPIFAGELSTLTATGEAHALCPGGARPATCPRCTAVAVRSINTRAGLFHGCSTCGWERFLTRGGF